MMKISGICIGLVVALLLTTVVSANIYTMKDNESNYMTTIQLAVYGSLSYKLTFTPNETYDVGKVSFRMGAINLLDSVPIKVMVVVKNLNTGQSGKFLGVPYGVVSHGLLPWVNMTIRPSVHFEKGQSGEITLSSDGCVAFVDGALKSKATVFYVTRDPHISYNRGALYRYQYWNGDWFKFLFNNKPYEASFRLWSVIQTPVGD